MSDNGKLQCFRLQAALPLLCISAVGWIVYVVGFSLFYQKSR